MNAQGKACPYVKKSISIEMLFLRFKRLKVLWRVFAHLRRMKRKSGQGVEPIANRSGTIAKSAR
jgi:hypothetical protein